jgi:putative transposase
MVLSHKIKLEPKPSQLTPLAKAAGVSRFTYNWALAEWNKQYEQGLKPTAFGLKKQFNHIKGELYPWVYDSPKDANQQPFSNLGRAFSNFFKHQAGRPQFKKKGVHDSFYLSNDKFRISGIGVEIHHIGRIKLTERLRFNGEIQGATVSRIADRWFISIQVECGDVKKERTGNEISGHDLGINTFLTQSNGTKIDAPKPLKHNLERIKRLHQSVSRKKKGSSNRKKAIARLSKAYYKTACIRNDFLNKLTTQLCRENQTNVIEDLNVMGMLKNRCLARAIADLGWGEFRRQMTYKSPIYDSELVVADRWFPSSKLCPICGKIKEDLTLADRVFKCECGFEMDRDLKSSIVLEILGSAGPEVTPEDMLALVLTRFKDLVGTKLTWVNQELGMFKHI